MKKIGYFLFMATTITSIAFIQGCTKDTVSNPKQMSTLDLDINKYIWRGLNTYYLWVDNVPDLSVNSFKTVSDWTSYLKKHPDHEEFFYSLLYNYGEVDKWSWIVDDYVALEKMFQGVTKSMGIEYGLALYGDKGDVLAYIKYVIKGSPAEDVGLKRGDVFIKVNGVKIDTSNYNTILYDKDSYTLTMAHIDTVNVTVIPDNRTVQVIPAEVSEDPIYMDTVLNVDNMKIGYLVYNGFMSNYDIKLNNVFSRFKSEGIQKLILDLRYNPGGSVQSARYLSSMIYSTDTNKIFMYSHYNKMLEDTFGAYYGLEFFIDRFTGRIEKTDVDPETPISSLNLNQVYIITTGSTASASELVINCLRPYMDVVTVGTTTVGKYVGSATIYDWNDSDVPNPKHTWAMQPIIMKTSNVNGATDYVNGLTPTVEVEEYVSRMKPFGSSDEALLSATINKIRNLPVKKSLNLPGMRIIADSKDIVPHGKEMHVKLKCKKIPKFGK
jgi:carboxyl-terminal processing protease